MGADTENRVKVRVDGEVVELDITAETAIVREQLDEDMDRIASRIAWYGRLLSVLVAHRDSCDDRYRHWRATKAQDVLSRDAKVAEWRVKMSIEADPQFPSHREAIRKANELVIRIEKAIDALEIKAGLLRSIGARERAELESTGMSTPAASHRSSAEARSEMVRTKMAERRARFGRSQPQDDEESEDVDP